MAENIAQQMLDDYIDELHAGLRKLPREESLEIVAEIRSHIRDSAEVNGSLDATSMRAVLARLGDARALSSAYAREAMVERATKSRSPFVYLRVLMAWAKTGFAGFWVFIGAVIGYGLSLALAICALLKPFFPNKVGFWWSPGADDLVLGMTKDPHARELLGVWMIPFCIITGGLAFMLTTWMCRWYIRYMRKNMTSVRSTLG